MNIQEFKQKYPQYNKLSDQELADRVYDKYYSGEIDRGEYYKRIGYSPIPGVGQPQEPVTQSQLTQGAEPKDLTSYLPSKEKIVKSVRRSAFPFVDVPTMPGEKRDVLREPEPISTTLAAFIPASLGVSLPLKMATGAGINIAIDTLDKLLTQRRLPTKKETAVMGGLGALIPVVGSLLGRLATKTGRTFDEVKNEILEEVSRGTSVKDALIDKLVYVTKAPEEAPIAGITRKTALERTQFTSAEAIKKNYIEMGMPEKEAGDLAQETHKTITILRKTPKKEPKYEFGKSPAAVRELPIEETQAQFKAPRQLSQMESEFLPPQMAKEQAIPSEFKAGKGVKEEVVGSELTERTKFMPNQGRVFGTKNKIFTEDIYREAAKSLKKKAGRLRTGIDPTDLTDLMKVGGYYIEGGIREFGDWSAKMVDDFGDAIKPHLDQIYRSLIKEVPEVTMPEGVTRLYRAETAGTPTAIPDYIKTDPRYKETIEATGRWFSDTLENAKYYQKTFGEGKPITYVDVPTKDIEKFRASNLPAGKFSAMGRAKEEFFLSSELAAQRKPLTEIAPKTPQAIVEGVGKTFQEARVALAQKQKIDWSNLKPTLMRGWVDVSGKPKGALMKTGGKEVVMNKDLVAGASAKANRIFRESDNAIYGSLNRAKHEFLDELIQSKRNFTISEYKPEVAHPGGWLGQDYKTYLESRLKDLPPEEAKDMLNRATQYFNTMKSQLDELLQNEVISQEAYDALKNFNYQPRQFIQYIDPPAQSYDFLGRKITVPDSGIKSLEEGSEQFLEIDSRKLLAQVIQRTQARAFKNRANQALYNLAETNPGNGIVTIWKSEDAAPHGWEKVHAMIKGQPQAMIMPEDMAKDWVRNDPLINAQLGEVLEWVTGTKLLKMSATTYNPLFWMTNVPRDLVHMWVAADEYSSIVPIAMGQQASDVATVIGDAITRKGRYIDYINQGGGMDFLTTQASPFVGMAPESIPKGLDALDRFTRYMGETSEIIGRLALRERAIKNGKTPLEATWIARNYIDFNQGGNYSKATDKFFPYFNAAVQGARGVAREFGKHPVKQTFKFAQLGGLATGLYMANRLTNPEAWEQVSDTDKVNYWIFTTPHSYIDEEGQKRYMTFKIAKDQDIRPVTTFFDAMMEKYLDGKVPSKQVWNAMGQFLPGVTSLPPFFEAYRTYISNYDAWRQKPVWQGGSQYGVGEIKSEEEYYKSTHPFWIEVGKATGLSPERLKAGLGKVFTWNNVFANAVGSGWKVLTGQMSDELQEQTWTQILADNPYLSRIIGQTLPYSPKEDEAIGEVGIEEKTRRFQQNRQLEMLMDEYQKGKSTNEPIRQFILAQPTIDRDRLKSRIKNYIALQNIPEKRIWLDIAELPPPQRAQMFYNKFSKATPQEKEEMRKIAKQLPSFLSKDTKTVLKYLIRQEQMQ